MADSKITALTAISTVDPTADPLVIVDVSDTSMAASGTTKKSTINQLLGAGGTATLASATITGDLTVDTSTLKVDSANNRVGVNTATPSYPLHVLTNAVSGRFNLSNIDRTTANWARITNPQYATDASAGLILRPFPDSDLRQGAGIIASGGTNNGDTNVALFVSSGIASSTSFAAYATTVSGSAVSHDWYQSAGSTAMTLNSTGLIRGASSADIISSESTTLTNIGNIGAAYAATTGTYFVAKVGAANGIVELKADARSGAYPPMVFTTGATERLRIDSSGNVGIGVTPSAGKGCLQLSSGINFPATQVASSDANTLDDYEEGTWTGTLQGGTTSPTTPVTATGRYTKIGRVVTLQINFANVNTTGASGNLFISGIPFTNSSVGSYGTAASYSAATFTGTLVCVIDPNDASSLILLDVKSNAAWAIAQHNAGTGRYVNATITYTV